MKFVTLLAVLGLVCCGCAPADKRAPRAETAADDPDPELVLEEARDLSEQGRYEEALEKHLWYHEHALEYDPNLSAVRLSFALGYWVELGEVYPKARAALVAIRDRGERTLRGGLRSFELFQEVAAINTELKEQPKTVDLFKALRASAPEFARACYPVAERDLAAIGEYLLCAAYVQDPMARLRRREELREIDLKRNAEERPELLELTEQMFVDDACQLIAILVGAGRQAEAEKVHDRAVTVSNKREFKEALDKALRGEWRPERE